MKTRSEKLAETARVSRGYQEAERLRQSCRRPSEHRMMESRQIPSNVISRLAYELGWSDGKLARKAGITRSRLNRIKNGRIRPSVRDALLISRALGSPLEEVFRFVGDQAAPTPSDDRRWFAGAERRDVRTAGSYDLTRA